MEAIGNLRTIKGLLLLLSIAVAVIAWLIIAAPTPAVRGQPPALPPRVVSAQVLPPLDIDEDQDEIDPKACATVILKMIEGPVLVDSSVIQPALTIPVGESVVREQVIVHIIQACNVDDRDEPCLSGQPCFQREIDTEIEVFSIICEKLSDLSEEARCEALRVAQEDNSDIAVNLSGAEVEPH